MDTIGNVMQQHPALRTVYQLAEVQVVDGQGSCESGGRNSGGGSSGGTSGGGSSGGTSGGGSSGRSSGGGSSGRSSGSGGSS